MCARGPRAPPRDQRCTMTCCGDAGAGCAGGGGKQRVHLQPRVLHGCSGSAINHRNAEGGTKLDRWRHGGEKEVKE